MWIFLSFIPSLGNCWAFVAQFDRFFLGEIVWRSDSYVQLCCKTLLRSEFCLLRFQDPPGLHNMNWQSRNILNLPHCWKTNDSESVVLGSNQFVVPLSLVRRGIFWLVRKEYLGILCLLLHCSLFAAFFRTKRDLPVLGVLFIRTTSQNRHFQASQQKTVKNLFAVHTLVSRVLSARQSP